jgi:hypothetical protein
MLVDVYALRDERHSHLATLDMSVEEWCAFARGRGPVSCARACGEFVNVNLEICACELDAGHSGIHRCGNLSWG